MFWYIEPEKLLASGIQIRHVGDVESGVIAEDRRNIDGLTAGRARRSASRKDIGRDPFGIFVKSGPKRFHCTRFFNCSRRSANVTLIGPSGASSRAATSNSSSHSSNATAVTD